MLLGGTHVLLVSVRPEVNLCDLRVHAQTITFIFLSCSGCSSIPSAKPPTGLKPSLPLTVSGLVAVVASACCCCCCVCCCCCLCLLLLFCCCCYSCCCFANDQNTRVYTSVAYTFFSELETLNLRTQDSVSLLRVAPCPEQGWSEAS